jgi:hypothetical protein
MLSPIRFISSLFVIGTLAVAGVEANHAITFKNNCSGNITPAWKAGSGGLSKGSSLARGASQTISVPETVRTPFLYLILAFLIILLYAVGGW